MDGKKGQKRRNSKPENDSSEKPSKKQQSSTHDSKHENVNKPKKSLKNKTVDKLQTVNMSTYIPNIDSPILPGRSNIPQYTTQQMSTPNLTSPTGYYPYGPQPIPNIQPVMHSTMNMGHDTNIKIDNLDRKVEEMLTKLSMLDSFGEKIDKFERSMQTFSSNVGKITDRVGDIEKSLDFINSQFEGNRSDLSDMKSEVTAIRSENNEVAENMQKVQKNFDELQGKHLDLQIRSMRENLVFTGIPMATENEESDTTEGILKLFMKEDMKMETEIDFHRAHRFGQLNERKNRDGTTFKTKPIVCRFKSFKDREIVRKSATNLKGTTFGVSEQFPKEINERRKLLWPYYKEARKQNKKALIKRDRLFIDGKEIKPLQSDIAENTTRREFQSQGARPKTRRRNRRDDITSDETASNGR